MVLACERLVGPRLSPPGHARAPSVRAVTRVIRESLEKAPRSRRVRRSSALLRAALWNRTRWARIYVPGPPVGQFHVIQHSGIDHQPMADFCGRALAYITGRPFEDFRKKKTTELSYELLAHLKEKPWLIVFDGIERVLV